MSIRDGTGSQQDQARNDVISACAPHVSSRPSTSRGASRIFLGCSTMIASLYTMYIPGQE